MSAQSHLHRSDGETSHAVRMGMNVQQAQALNDLLLRCPEDVAATVGDQLWLRTVFIMRRQKLEHRERTAFDARCDRILTLLDPKDPA